jgi:hypothetical protein
MISIPGSKKVRKECLKKLDEWEHMLRKLDIAEPQASSIYDSLKVFQDASSSLLDTWQLLNLGAEHEVFKLEVKQGVNLEVLYVLSAMNMEEAMEYFKERWLHSVFQIEKIGSLLSINNTESNRKTMQKGYELIFKFLIDFQKNLILSKEDLSYFLNEETHGQLIATYATNIYTHFDPIKETASVNLDIKHSLEMSKSVDGFPYLLSSK